MEHADSVAPKVFENRAFLGSTAAGGGSPELVGERFVCRPAMEPFELGGAERSAEVDDFFFAIEGGSQCVHIRAEDGPPFSKVLSAPAHQLFSDDRLPVKREKRSRDGGAVSCLISPVLGVRVRGRRTPPVVASVRSR